MKTLTGLNGEYTNKAPGDPGHDDLVGRPQLTIDTNTNLLSGPDTSTGARVTSLDTYNSILDYFQSQGYNEIDTARCYVGGQQEAFTCRARWKERGLSCATKWYPYGADEEKAGAHKADRIEEMLNKSLSELGTDCVDIFYLHAPDRTTPFQEPLRKLNELHKLGKFVQLGLSNYTAYEVAEIVMLCRVNGWVQPTVRSSPLILIKYVGLTLLDLPMYVQRHHAHH